MFVSSPTSWHVLIHDCSWPSTNTLQDYGAAVNSLDFHRTEDLLITGCDDDSIRVYNTAEGSRVETLFCSAASMACPTLCSRTHHRARCTPHGRCDVLVGGEAGHLLRKFPAPFQRG